VGVPALRPLALGEILDVSIKISLRHAKTLALIVLALILPVQIVIGLIDMSLTEGAYTTGGETIALEDEDIDWAAFVAGYAIILVLGILGPMIGVGAAFKAVIDAYLGHRPTWRDSVSYAVKRLPSLLWLTVLVLVFGFFLALPCLIPLIWLGVAWAVALPALLTEDVRGVEALRRSFRLVRGFWWRTFGLLLLAMILISVVDFAITTLFTSLVLAADTDATILVAQAIGGTLSSLLTWPFVAALVTVIYVDLRVRKEAFDLALLAERIGRDPGQPPAIPAPPLEAPVMTWSGTGQPPPFWPPPPGWQPAAPAQEPAPGAEPAAAPQEPAPEQPPFWPPPPGWQPAAPPPAQEPAPGWEPPAATPEPAPDEPATPPAWPPMGPPPPVTPVDEDERPTEPPGER
jgi:hypothetical protein